VDLLTVAGHKLYAPKGVGALFVRRGVELEPLIRGAGHEGGLRAGTENVLGEVGLGAACELVRTQPTGEIGRLRHLRDGLESALLDRWPGVRFHGHREHRLPNTSSVALPGIDAGLLLERVADEVAASAGAACHSGSVRMSHVLAAMGVDEELARGTLRLSLGRCTTGDEIGRGLTRLLEVAREIVS
jgi:cysteine desulfurase